MLHLCWTVLRQLIVRPKPQSQRKQKPQTRTIELNVQPTK